MWWGVVGAWWLEGERQGWAGGVLVVVWLGTGAGGWWWWWWWWWWFPLSSPLASPLKMKQKTCLCVHIEAEHTDPPSPRLANARTHPHGPLRLLADAGHFAVRVEQPLPLLGVLFVMGCCRRERCWRWSVGFWLREVFVRWNAGVGGFLVGFWLGEGCRSVRQSVSRSIGQCGVRLPIDRSINEMRAPCPERQAPTIDHRDKSPKHTHPDTRIDRSPRQSPKHSKKPESIAMPSGCSETPLNKKTHPP